MKEWQKFKGSFGETPTITLSDDERHIAFEMRKKIDTILQEESDTSTYRRSYDRVKRERRQMLKNPVRCSQCRIKKTCHKRLVHNLRKCPYGIRKNSEPKS